MAEVTTHAIGTNRRDFPRHASPVRSEDKYDVMVDHSRGTDDQMYVIQSQSAQAHDRDDDHVVHHHGSVEAAEGVAVGGGGCW